ncbi:hypothetical protein [Absidia glauca]|uniref:Uncharacterized protein n=1 Tax=Absidia glauca TaxID=4829 RepID=A0A168S439_ABSGL|nr:hypothetical protein [Absidia glauca]
MIEWDDNRYRLSGTRIDCPSIAFQRAPLLDCFPLDTSTDTFGTAGQSSSPSFPATALWIDQLNHSYETLLFVLNGRLHSAFTGPNFVGLADIQIKHTYMELLTLQGITVDYLLPTIKQRIHEFVKGGVSNKAAGGA